MSTDERGLARSRRRRRTGGLVLAMVVGAFVAAGCGDSDSDTSSGSGTTAASSAHVGKSVAIVHAIDDGYHRQVSCGAEEEGKRLGFDMLSPQSSKVFDPAKQAAVTSAVLARSPDALVYNPADPKAGLPPVKAAVAQGLKIATVDNSLSDPSVVTSFVASDHYAGGRLAAQELLREIDGKGKVLAIGLVPDHPITKGRIGGFESIIKTAPGVEFLGTRYPEIDIAKVAGVVAAILRAHPDVKAIYTSENGFAGAGTVTAIRDAGLKGKVKHVTWDYDPNGLKNLKSGDITALVAQNPREMGRIAVRELANSFDEKPVKKTVHAPLAIVTAENFSTPESEKLFYGLKC